MMKCLFSTGVQRDYAFQHSQSLERPLHVGLSTTVHVRVTQVGSNWSMDPKMELELFKL